MASYDTVPVVRSVVKHDYNHPSPTHLEMFIPWACGQLQFPFVPVIKKVSLTPHVRQASTRGKGKEEVANIDAHSPVSNVDDISNASNKDTYIFIETIYDSNDSLIQVKFNQNIEVPVNLLKLFSLIAHFHTSLTAIYINRGLNQSGLYQVNKIVNAAKITEVILDNTVIQEANYYILLDGNCSLKHLSLGRCSVNDRLLKMIVSKLTYPSKASKTLSILNLSSNRITDEGAKYLGDMLRANRQLTYLNLLGNMISDVGADSILSILTAFPLTAKEISQKKTRKFIYMKEKKKLVEKIVVGMRSDYLNKYAGKKKNIRSTVFSSKRAKSVDINSDSDRVSVSPYDSAWLENAEAAAEETVEPFQDPFNNENTILRNGRIYCYGNNVLCYLNLAYNNLSYFSVTKLLEVMNFQRDIGRKPQGLMYVCIEGNQLPEACPELTEIDILMEIGLARLSNMSGILRKKNAVRTK